MISQATEAVPDQSMLSSGPQSTGRSAGLRMEYIVAIVCGLALVAPIWLMPVLPTTDGPSHLYNAIVANAIKQGTAPYNQVFSLSQIWLAPNQAAQYILGTLGPWLGWETAERVLVSVSTSGIFFLLLMLVRVAIGQHAVVFAPIIAWLAQNWFMWMGFYDFSLSIVGFLLLVVSLLQSNKNVGALAVVLVLPLIFISHFFTFVISVGMIMWVFALRLRSNSMPKWQIATVIPGMLLLFGTVLSGRSGGGGGMGWEGRMKAFAGLIVGDFLVSFHPVDLTVSITLMLLFWWGAAQAIRHATALNADYRALSIFALLLIFAALAGPDRVGEGSYIGARLRFLAVLSFLPVFALLSKGWLLRHGMVLRTCILVVFLIHTGLIIQRSYRVDEDLRNIEGLLRRSGAKSGEWVRTALLDRERGLFRISAYGHLVERAAYRNQLLVLDNYEAYLSIFSVGWIERPDGLRITESDQKLHASFTGQGRPLDATVYVIHEADYAIAKGEECIEVGGSQQSGDFAVTAVRPCAAISKR